MRPAWAVCFQNGQDPEPNQKKKKVELNSPAGFSKFELLKRFLGGEVDPHMPTRTTYAYVRVQVRAMYPGTLDEPGVLTEFRIQLVTSACRAGQPLHRSIADSAVGGIRLNL